MSTKLSIGPTTIGGVLVALAGFITAAVVALNEGGFPVASKYATIAATVVTGLTQLGRYLQAHALIKSGKEA